MNNFLEIKNVDIVKLSPKYLDNNIQEHIKNSLKKKYEGLCSKFGYIKSNSIKLLSIKSGVVERSTFHGYVKFHVEFLSSICNPAINSIVKCTVKNINSFGILCVSGIYENAVFVPILNIVIPKKHHSIDVSNNVSFDKININDEVNVEILGKKYILNNKNINVFGRIVDQVPNDRKTRLDTNITNTESGEINNDGVSDDEEDNISIDEDHESNADTVSMSGGENDNDKQSISSSADDDESADDVDLNDDDDELASNADSISDSDSAFD